MLLTAEDAKERWCHMTFGNSRMKCIVSDCMAWRWAEDVPQVCISCGGYETSWKDEPEQRKGYCGLAGIAKF
ncbi:MAG: hypothetical protein HZA17_08620 [Nitrospirae bacterium]|nr:hypothetical protein [Nitrospirota bacterium]